MTSQQKSGDSEAQEPSDPRELKQDALVEKLVPDPAAPPDTIRLVGFLGKGTRAGYWRLYLTSQLNEYVECHEDDVVHTQSLATEQNPLAGTMAWIKRGAKLLHSRTTSVQAQAEFFQGNIMDRFLMRSPMGAPSASRRPIPLAHHTNIFICTLACTYGGILCWATQNQDPNCQQSGLACPFNTVDDPVCPSYLPCVTNDPRCAVPSVDYEC